MSSLSVGDYVQLLQTLVIPTTLESYVLILHCFPNVGLKNNTGILLKRMKISSRKKLLGCKICREISKVEMGMYNGIGIKFSKEWIDCKVNSNDDNKSKQIA